MWWRNRVERRVSDLEERQTKVERAFKELELDWLHALDKLKSLMGRIAKRAEVIERGAIPADGTAPLTPGRSPGAGVDPISAQILARRNRLASQLPDRQGRE